VTDAARWTKKSVEQQDRCFHRFLKAPIMTTSHAVTSSDGGVLVLESAACGKKKNQLNVKEQPKPHT